MDHLKQAAEAPMENRQGMSFYHSDLSSLATESQLTPQDMHLRLAFTMHTSLEFRSILESFLEGITQEIAVTGIEYQHGKEDIHVSCGDKALHHINYNLQLGEEHLGSVTLQRHTAFTVVEIAQIEKLLCLLLHPLKNALQYHTALQSALRDPLTALPNRTALQQTLTRDIQLAKRHNLSLSMLALDLDHFKAINDNYGHAAGDEVLRRFSKQLALCVRESDMIFRVGGEEFIVLLSKTNIEGAIMTADRIRCTVEETPCRFRDHDLYITVSIGVANYASGDRSDTLIEKADKALYLAKAQGRNRVCI